MLVPLPDPAVTDEPRTDDRARAAAAASDDTGARADTDCFTGTHAETGDTDDTDADALADTDGTPDIRTDTDSTAGAHADSGTDTGESVAPDFAPVVLGPDGLLRPAWADRGEAVRRYFDTEWGTPVRTESGLHELLVLLVFAGGLTWAGVLARRESLREALARFDPDAIAAFTDGDVDALAADVRMIRNRRKIAAVVTNARATCALRERGGLVDLLWVQAAGEGAIESVDVAEMPRSNTRSEHLAGRLTAAGFTHIGPVAAQALLLAAGVVPVRRGGVEAGSTAPTRRVHDTERRPRDLAQGAGS